MLRRTPGFTGACFAYEPDADQDDAAYLAGNPSEKTSMDENGRFLGSFKPYKSSKFVLISRNGKIIASNMDLASEKRFRLSLEEMKDREESIDESQLNKRMLSSDIADTDYSGILIPFYKMEENISFSLMKKKGPLDARDYYFAGRMDRGNAG